MNVTSRGLQVFLLAIVLAACSSTPSTPVAVQGQSGAGSAAGTVAVAAGRGAGTSRAGASAITTAAGTGGRSSSAAGHSATSAPTSSSAADSGTPLPSDGSCDPGTTTSEWAKDCPTAPAATCIAGSWTAVGSNTGDPLVLESEHFAIYAPGGTVTNAQAQAALDVLEKTIWPAFMGPPLLFPEPYCNSATKHKVSIMIHQDYGLSGGGWDGNLGMWIGPGATSDHWGLAHEFTHTLQTSTGGLASSDYTGWIWESHANWHAHQLAEYHDKNVHCSEMLPNFPHLYLGSTRDRYCNWQFMEYLKDTHCPSAVEDIFAKAPKSGAEQKNASPFSVLQANQGWTVDQLNDFFGQWAMHNVVWDYKNLDGSDQGVLYRKSYGAITDVANNAQGAPAGFRRLRLTQLEPLDAAAKQYVTPSAWAPQRFGYNVVRLYPDAAAQTVRVTFRGVLQDAPASKDFGNFANQPAAIDAPSSDWRWGLVAVDASGAKPRYSKLMHGADGALSFCVTAADAQLYLVVMATPSKLQQIEWDQAYYTVYRYPWMMQLEGALPEGFQPSAARSGGAKWANGGGWVASAAKVDASAYVGPYAQVLGGSVTANARIDEHAVVVSGNISGSAVVKGLSVVSNGLSVADSAVVASVFQGPGTFEGGQKVSGTAQLWGDIELRGQGINVATGVFYGFVDNTTLTANPSQGATRTAPSPEVTVAPPYAWRP